MLQTSLSSSVWLRPGEECDFHVEQTLSSVFGGVEQGVRVTEHCGVRVEIIPLHTWTFRKQCQHQNKSSGRFFTNKEDRGDK